jgi:hypothetical protein
MNASKKLKALITVTALAVGLSARSAGATPIQSYSDVLGGAPLANFEGFAKGTIIVNQYAGVTFGQADGGTPMIDNYPWLFGYGASSGSGVLTGSTNGGAPFPTVAGITATFATPQKSVEMFLGDTSSLGDYTIFAYGAGNTLLESFTVPGSAVLPPGYSGGLFPPPGTCTGGNTCPGIYVGFNHSVADIVKFQVGPSSAFGDAFAVDDLRVGTQSTAVPEPSTMLLLGTGIATLVRARVRRRESR